MTDLLKKADENPTRDEPAVPVSSTPEPAAPAADVPEVEESEVVETPDQKEARILEKIGEDIDNEATTLAVYEFLNEQDLDIDDVTIEQGMWNWPQGRDIAHVQIGRRGHGADYFVSPDDETTTTMAVVLAKNSAKEGILNQNFLRDYIDMEALRDALSADVEEDIRRNARGHKVLLEEPEEEYDAEGNVTDQEEIDAFEGGIDDDAVEARVAEILRDPIEYLKQMYSDEEALQKAMEMGGINYDEAAEDAVAQDGEGSYLGTYDGEVRDLPSGGQYWRHN